MKSLKQLSAAVVLTLTLTLPALAGEIQLPAGTSPPPPPTSAMEGEIHTPLAGDIQIPAASTDSVIIALNLLQSMLALF